MLWGCCYRLPGGLVALLCITVGAVLEGQGPLIVLEPAARVEFTNSSGARLDCAAQGSPPASVTWTAAVGMTAGLGMQTPPGPVPSVPSLRHQLHNGSLLFLPFPASAYRPDVHDVAYRCVASNPIGRVLGREVKLRAVVLQPYELRVQGTVVSRGNTALLRCLVPRVVRDFLTVSSWLQDDSFNIYPSSDGDGKFHMLPSGDLLVLNAGIADTYSTYHCRATHRLSDETLRSSLPGKITVTDAPSEAVPPRALERAVTVEARRDELVALPCLVESHPQPEFRWYSVSEGGGSPLQDTEHRYAVGGVLVLNRARPADSGRYLCIANNTAGTERVEFTLLVSAPLGVHVTPAHATVDLSRSAEFMCSTVGHPVTSVMWTKDGILLREGQRVRFAAKDKLQILSVQREDQGMYQCFAKNDYDMAQGSAELRLGDTPPQLMYKFIQQTIQPGPSVSLKCVASGNPTPTIKWTLDGFPLPQNNERFVIGQYVPSHGDVISHVISHVNISSVRVEDGGTYQCTAFNRVGEASHSAQLNIYGLPHVRSMPEISAVAGETLYVACPVAGYPIDSVQWYRGDRMLPINRRRVVFPNGTLMIENLQPKEDGGSYTCSASNKQGHTASGVAEIKIMVPPKLNPFSFRSDLHLGERVGLQCMVSKGDPPLTITWLKDDLPLAQSSDVMVRNPDEFTSSVAISALSPRHSGNYTCVARNKVAEASHSAALSVNVPPAITPFTFGELSKGERVKVTCSVKRGDTPLSISWMKDHQPVSHDLEIDIRDTEDYSSILAITSVRSRHSGNYTCVARNSAKETTYTAELIVTVPPSWKVEPQDRDAKLGEQVVLDCQVDGFPKPVISWKKAIGYKLGEYSELRPLQSSIQSVNNQDSTQSSMQLLTNGSLLLESVKQEDKGRYMCEASNGIGVGLSAVVQLTVNAPVHFKVRSKKELVRRGSNANLQCRALGDLPIMINWKKEGVYLNYHGSKSVKNTTLHDGGLLSELLIQNTRREDSGVYTCFASNNFGHDQMDIHLLVQDAPAQPTNLRVLEQNSRSVSLAWSQAQDGNSLITRYVITYRASDGSSGWLGVGTGRQQQPQQQVVDGGSTVAMLSNLQPASSYLVRVKAENQLGLGDPSDELQIRTSEEAPAASPRDVIVDARSSRQLLVTWSPPPPEAWYGQLLGHYVGCREISSGSVETAAPSSLYNFTTVSWQGIGKTEWRFDGLKKFFKYGIVIQAFNNKGAGPFSTEVVAQTLEDVPEAAPREVRCSPLSSTSLQINWQPPPEERVHGIIQGYRLYYEAALEELEDTQALAGSLQRKMTTSLEIDLNNLLKYTNYSVQVLAFTRVGDGARSDKIFCRTKEDAPGPPAELKLLSKTTDTALVTWLAPKQPNGIVLRYNVYVRVVEQTSGGSGGRQVETRINQTTALEMEISELKQRHRYEVWVTAFTRFGEGTSTPVAALTPTNKVSAAIASFGGPMMVAWRRDVMLPCRAVGQPPPQRQWHAAGQPVTQTAATGGRPPRIQLLQDGTLHLTGAQRTDEADYTCEVWNEYGRDRITHQLLVQVAPSAPLLLTTGNTESSIQLQWKLGDDGGSPIRGFVLHYKPDNGEWSEARVERHHSTFNLSNLRCGTQYHIYVTAHNRLGSSVPSTMLTVRTRGSKPQLPSSSPSSVTNDPLLVPNTTSVTLYLNHWPDGGCPILYFVIEYATTNAPASDWLSAGNNVQPQREFAISGLTPSTAYRVRIIVHNSAGATIANLMFSTSTLPSVRDIPGMGTSATVSSINVETHNGETGRTPFHKDVKVILPFGASVLALVLSFFSICFCLRKKSEANANSGQGCQQSNATPAGGADAKHNMQAVVAQRELYYATVRKPPPSPAPDFATLECIPEYSEDIYPYATFHVPPPPVSPQLDEAMSTKLQTFVYRGVGAELLQGAACRRSTSSATSPPTNRSKSTKIDRAKRSRCKLKTDRLDSEEYDSFASESDTEQGTSSRTESSNQLDDGPLGPLGITSKILAGGGGSGGGNAEATLHPNLLYPGGPESSTSTEPSPIAERRRGVLCGATPSLGPQGSRSTTASIPTRPRPLAIGPNLSSGAVRPVRHHQLQSSQQQQTSFMYSSLGGSSSKIGLLETPPSPHENERSRRHGSEDEHRGSRLHRPRAAPHLSVATTKTNNTKDYSIRV